MINLTGKQQAVIALGFKMAHMVVLGIEGTTATIIDKELGLGTVEAFNVIPEFIVEVKKIQEEKKDTDEEELKAELVDIIETLESIMELKEEK